MRAVAFVLASLMVWQVAHAAYQEEAFAASHKGDYKEVDYGLQGRYGMDGTDGYHGHDGGPGKDGRDGGPGKDGKDGRDGRDGQDANRCAGGTTTVSAASPVFDFINVGSFRELTVSCSGAATCAKENSVADNGAPCDHCSETVDGCVAVAQPNTASAGLTPYGPTNVVGPLISGATQQVGGDCRMICPDNKPRDIAYFSLYNVGWSSLVVDAKTTCSAVMTSTAAQSSNLNFAGCRLVATAVCCVPQKGS